MFHSPVSINRRLNIAIASTFRKVIAEGLLTQHEAHLEAIRRVARTLPVASGYRLPKPSKSDNPGYRKPNVLKHLRHAVAA